MLLTKYLNRKIIEDGGISLSTVKKNKVKNSNGKKYTSQIIGHFFLMLWAALNILPFIWVIMNSFKESKYVTSKSFSLPTSPTLQNYINAFNNLDIGRAYLNSFIISTSVTLLTLLIAGMAAFAIARFKFKGKSILMALIIASLMIPIFSTIIPIFNLLHQFNLINKLIGLILPITGGSISFAIVILVAYMRGIPNEIEESAVIDGCNIFQVCFRMIFPLSKPAFATVAVFTFLWSYNDLFTQLFILRQRETWAINRLLNEISSQYGTDYGLMAASVTLVIVPVLIVYMFLQKSIIKGLTAGAVKG